MIHRYDAVELPTLGFGKDAVGRYGTLYVEAALLQLFDGRNNLLSLLPAEHAVLAAMGIQTSHANVGFLNAELAAGIVDEFDTLHDTGFLHQITSLSQRYVGRDMDDADSIIGKHHSIFLGMCKRCVNLGMAIKVMTCQVQCFLVQRGGDGAIDLVSHGQLYRLLDILEGSIAALCLYLAKLKGAHIYTLQVIDINGTKLKLGILHALHGMDLQVIA